MSYHAVTPGHQDTNTQPIVPAPTPIGIIHTMAATLAANVSSVHPYHLQNLPKFAIMFETLLMLALAPFIRSICSSPRMPAI